MTVQLLQQKLREKPVQRALLVGLGYVVVAGIFLRHYLLWDTQWLLGLLLLPLVTLPGPARKVSPFLLALAFLLLLLAGIYQISTLYFLGFLVAGWCTLQSTVGMNGIYPVLLLGMVSPIFSYMTSIWSFPLRLQLTEMAVYVLSFIQPKVEVAGNLILLNGQEFSVDPACAGLNMLAFSMLLAVFLMAHRHRVTQKPWPPVLLGAFLLLMLGLNVGSNLLRILLLVLFKVGPDNKMHDALGLLCLVLYAVLPFYCVLKFFGNKLSSPISAGPKVPLKRLSWPSTLRLNGLLLLGLTVAGLQIIDKKPLQAASAVVVAGFQQELLPDGIQKWTNNRALVYLKPIKGFYSAEHHPMICWQGSGYQFQDVREITIAGKQLYTGILQKKEEQLYTAWWMDNGGHQTIAQSDWRWRMFKGEPVFQLVNVTAATPEELEQVLHDLLRNKKIASATAGK